MESKIQGFSTVLSENDSPLPGGEVRSRENESEIPRNFAKTSNPWFEVRSLREPSFPGKEGWSRKNEIKIPLEFL